MKTVKFYYSKPVHVRLAPIVTDVQGNPLYIAKSIEDCEKPSYLFPCAATSIVRTVPRVTVASVYDPDTDTMCFGVAVCSPNDTFKKEIGRKLAEERARTKPNIKIVKIKKGRIRNVSKRYANQLISEILGFDVQSRF